MLISFLYDRFTIGLGLVNTEPYIIYIANINMNKLIIIVPPWVCKDDNCIVR